ncbi:sensor histidine kinase [Paenibacillus alkalitolerans]|uniref:sensor histidine kinase n=1 Tax=Paenibacillus alkalitolerans TaxID=2799335 RepID=UPI0018F71160|nr:HAMP domain-containing sensor histidine kinase [Paenibacillus alkalitolerans]
MIRTLYIRIVLLFLGVVAVSLAVGFFVSLYLHSSTILNHFEEELLEDGKTIASLYERAPSKDLNDFLSAVAELEKYDIVVFRPDGQSSFFSGRERVAEIPAIPQEAISRVLQGGIYRGLKPGSDRPGPHGWVGFPFETGEERFALFLLPSLRDEFEAFRTVMLTVLGIVLALGSLLFLVSARHLVRPIRALTEATKRLAKGDFDYRVPVSTTDELGTLARSFNSMAGELKQLDKMRQDFISNVSHEFQSPLTSIRGFAGALQDNDLPDEMRKSYLSIIADESGRLARLTDNLLRLAALDQDRVALIPKRFKLDDQLMRVVIAHEPQWQRKHIAVDMDVNEMSVEADEDLLWQVWSNLLGNAIRFTPDGGRIGISLKTERDRAIVEFADTGIGISEEDLPRIFERFFTADPSRERTKGGNGLGLAIVHRIVALHRGDIRVRSIPGEGTVFTVIIPGNVTIDS